MGAQLGFFSENAERDYPELNKCPDCLTFFDGPTCPLCGKECPENMRAGNRPKVKRKKQYRDEGARVQFIPWYQQTWFIVLMFFIQPIIALILMWTGVWKQSTKVIVTVVAVILCFAAPIGLFVTGIIWDVFHSPAEVDWELSDAEYLAKCEAVDPETLYRYSDRFEDDYVKLDLIVDGKAFYYAENVYSYDCYSAENENVLFTIVDYSEKEERVNYLPGDRITVYGEVRTGDDYFDTVQINVRFVVFSEQ